MPEFTGRHSIPYPVSSDLIKDSSTQAKLANDIRAVAVGSDAAISRAGAESIAKATTLSNQYADAAVLATNSRVLQNETVLLETSKMAGENRSRLSALEVIGGVAPGDISDAQMSGIAANSESMFSAQLDEKIRTGTGTVYLAPGGDAQAAVEEALAQNSTVVVSGSVAVAGNIPNFWSARFSGKGSLVRGGVEFFIDPKPSISAVQKNTVYLDAVTGDNNNDGLSPDYPLKSLAGLYFRVLRPMPADMAAGARWVISMRGDFSGGQKFASMPDFPHGLEFAGEPLDSYGKPQTIVRKSAGGSGIGLWFEPVSKTTNVSRIHFEGFTNGFNDYAVLGKGHGNLNITDCSASNCDIGFAAINNVDFYFNRCSTSSSVRNGFRTQYSSSGTFNACIADGAENFGFYVSRGSQVHIDYCTASSCGVGVALDMSARAHLTENQIRRNSIGVRAHGASEWIDGNNNFHVGSSDANTQDYVNFGVARETRLYSETARNEFQIGSAAEANAAYISPVTVTGSTANTVVYVGSRLGTIPANFFTGVGKRLRVQVQGTASLTTTATLLLYSMAGTSSRLLGSTTLASSMSSSSFTAEFLVWSLSPASQRTHVMLNTNNNASRSTNGVQSHSFVDSTNLRLYVQLGSASDSVSVHGMETFLMG